MLGTSDLIVKTFTVKVDLICCIFRTVSIVPSFTHWKTSFYLSSLTNCIWVFFITPSLFLSLLFYLLHIVLASSAATLIHGWKRMSLAVGVLALCRSLTEQSSGSCSSSLHQSAIRILGRPAQTIQAAGQIAGNTEPHILIFIVVTF